MKKFLVAGACAAMLVLGATTVVLASGTTTSDIAALATAESRVVSVLHTYQPTAAWRAVYRAAIAVQAVDIARVNAELPAEGTAPTSSHQKSKGLSFTDDNGVPYSVAVVGGWDPAQPSDEMDEPTAGDRFVAVQFRVTDTSLKHPVSDDANNDATIVGSNNETYNSSLDTVSECTNFNYGQFNLNPGESTTGCVVFDLSQAVRVSEVKWEAGFGMGGMGTWTFG